MTRYVLAPARDAAERIADVLRADGWHVHSGLDEPTPGWRLDRGRHVCVAEITDRQDVEAALLLAVRGAGIVAWTASREHAAELYDGLSRLGAVELVSADARPAEDLAPDQLRMLELLADGATQVEVADRLGWSRRTVTRRLAEARQILGAQSTAQAVVLWRRRSGIPER
jgi:DNA-binding CsgD family transcriptional regulator